MPDTAADSRDSDRFLMLGGTAAKTGDSGDCGDGGSIDLFEEDSKVRIEYNIN